MKHTRQKSNGMKRHMLLLPVFLVAVVALVLVAFAPVSWAFGGHNHEVVELEECEVFIEYNSTDGDFGVHFFWDGEPWKWMTVWNEHLWPVLNVGTGKNVRAQGLTEGFFESAEPSLLDLSFHEFLDRFPEDEYRFRGRTLNWERLVCETDFTHVIPCPPDIVDVVWNPATRTLSIEWNAVTTVVDPRVEIPMNGENGENGDIDISPTCTADTEPDIVGYEAVFELVILVDDEEQVYKETTTLPAGATMVTASPEFTRLAVRAERAANRGEIEGAELKFEVIAKEESGNSTITEEGVFELPEENGD
jgi:hypothetical protein